MRSNASTGSCEGFSHDHDDLHLQRLELGVHRTLPQLAPFTSQNHSGHLGLSNRRLWLQPLHLSKRWPTSSHRSCLWESALSAGSTPPHPTLAPAPTRQAGARSPFPHHLHPSRAPESLLPLSSQARLPKPVPGRLRGPQKTGPRCALDRHRPAWLYWRLTHLGPATPVSSPSPLPRPGRWTLQAARSMATFKPPVLCPRQGPLANLPSHLQSPTLPSRLSRPHCTTGLEHSLEGPQSGHTRGHDLFEIPRPICLQGGDFEPSSGPPQGPHRHLHVSPTWFKPASSHSPGGHRVDPSVPPTRLANGLRQSPTLWIYERQLYSEWPSPPSGGSSSSKTPRLPNHLQPQPSP
jgi:hypothetical protein